MNTIKKTNSVNAAVTIVSKNYFSYAKTLANSYKKNHPNHDFIIILADINNGEIPNLLDCGAEVIEVLDLHIPDIERFIYRYSILEFNTAIKPYALYELFNRRSYDTLIYLDPDILIFQPLAEVYLAFDKASILLTPHILKPYFDDKFPSDLSILQSGTYNLGFIGLKRSESALQLLQWWMEKLFKDCVVDLSRGLFVDQKWVDLIPGFFPDHHIIRSPGYNVAYWNLHERRLSGKADSWTVNDQPLIFFHFSGFIPIDQDTLSIHQNRHNLVDSSHLRNLIKFYGEALLLNGYLESSTIKYGFKTLSNGVSLPLQLVTKVMQWAINNDIYPPSPLSKPNDFCNFLMSEGFIPEAPKVALLYFFLLEQRPDVVQAFPGSKKDSFDPEFQSWVKNSGTEEYNIKSLISFQGGNENIDYVEDAFERLRIANRFDVFQAFSDMWLNEDTFEDFASWFSVHGSKEMGFTAKHTERILASRSGVIKILNIYIRDENLQKNCSLSDQKGKNKFISWLRKSRFKLDLSKEEISLFKEFSESQYVFIEKLQFLYQHNGSKKRVTPSIYGLEQRKRELGLSLKSEMLADWLVNESGISPIDHFLSYFDNQDLLLLPDNFGKYSIPTISKLENFKFLKAVVDHLQSPKKNDIQKINLAGFFSAISGMGESSRSMLMTLDRDELFVNQITLPNPKLNDLSIPKNPMIFGWPNSIADVSITVANADSMDLVDSFLPDTFWAKKNIGYWVWETEALPEKYLSSECLFQEIWTPSEYSAKAIRNTVNRKVRVLPHTLDFNAINMAASDRRAFGLPAEALLFGFIFDPSSVLERKNIEGLITLFQRTFRKDDNCFLVLKINGRAKGSYDFERICSKVTSDRILWIDDTYTRIETFSFIKSLDAYISLHRSEGFGLTCAEAMALGVPVMASNYSGNLEFMNSQNSLLVPTRVIQTDRPFGPYPAGTYWGDPNMLDAETLLRSLLNSDLRRHFGMSGSKSIRETLSTERISKMAFDFLCSI